MSRVEKWIVASYPAVWRQRYGEEIETLIEDAGGGWSARFDVLRGGVQMHFQKRSFAPIAAALGLIGAFAGLGASFLVTPQYVSTAQIELKAKRLAEPTGHMRLLDKVSEVTQFMRSRGTLSLIQSPGLDLYANERLTTPLEMIIKDLDRNIDFTVDGYGEDSVLVNVAFRYPDRFKAQVALKALTSQIADYVSDVEGYMHRDAATAARIVIVREPNLPFIPEGPDRRMFTLGGLGCGILLAIALTIRSRTLDDGIPAVVG